MKNEINGAEALFGFAGWLTSRKEETVASSSHDAGCIADLVGQFCKENKLTEPREGWQYNSVYPSGGNK